MIVTVEAGAQAALLRGHPWVYREAIQSRRSLPLEMGQPVRLGGADGARLGWGLYDAESPIAIRRYGRADEPKLDAAVLERSIAGAIAKRDDAFDPLDTSAYRLCHGEGDRVPGLVIDRYGETAVVRTDGEAIARWLDRLVPALARILQPRGVRSILARVAGAANQEKTRPLWGDPAPDTTTVLENGMHFEVDLARGQKTGAFLDQRDNRRRVREIVRPGARVLNLFSYAGGFSVAAALGGAKAVTSVDSATRAHATAQRSFRKNGLDPGEHAFVTADAFAFLDAAARRKETFDLVISDPPSFAPNEKSKRRALSAYARLHAACCRVLAPGGTFCASSCSSHVGLEDFMSTLDDVAIARADLSVQEAFGAPWDHPTLACFPEGRYLKFVVMR